jgi:hypothetical protein
VLGVDGGRGHVDEGSDVRLPAYLLQVAPAAELIAHGDEVSGLVALEECQRRRIDMLVCLPVEVLCLQEASHAHNGLRVNEDASQECLFRFDILRWQPLGTDHLCLLFHHQGDSCFDAMSQLDGDGIRTQGLDRLR